jgi:ATP-binding cassette subfamily B protein
MSMMPGEKAKDFGGSVRRLLSYLKAYNAGIIVVCVFAILSTLFAIASPMILGQATTEVFRGAMAAVNGTGGIDFPAIGRIAIVLLSLYLVSAAFSFLQGFIMSGIAMKVSNRMRADIEAKMHRLPLKYFDNRSYGDVLSLITNDVDTVTQSLNQSVTQIISSVTTLVGILAMMFVISWQMTLVALAIVPLSFFFVTFIVKKSQGYFKSQQAGIGKINGHVEELYGSHVVMKAFGGESAALAEFDRINGELYHSVWRAQFLSGLMMPVMGFIGNLGYVAVCILGGYLAINGRLSVGGIQAFIQYVRQFNQPITQVANVSNVLQSMAAAAERVFKFLVEEEETADPSEPAVTGGAVRGLVEFDHVHFGYDPAKIVIKDFSARVEPGQKIAIVGPTGAGKTTIVKLLMRFYDLNSGAILVDGVDITKFARDDIRSEFGMVLQDTWLYNATIRENIRYGRLSATDDEVLAAARAAQVDHFVRTLPGGYDFVLNEEASNISRGQKQLLTIARAILADPKVLILDEATSSVDTLTEVLIQKAMDHLMSGRTSFVIAHRLSTIRNADLILVMRDGNIVEQGTHDALLESGGFYAELYRSQFDEADE